MQRADKECTFPKKVCNTENWNWSILYDITNCKIYSNNTQSKEILKIYMIVVVMHNTLSIWKYYAIEIKAKVKFKLSETDKWDIM